jgi:hypothetical protein
MATAKTNLLESSFGNRFMGDYIGDKMLSDPITAIVELIANAWDAGARTVEIVWPNGQNDDFVIADDGHGLTSQEFAARWTMLAYNRLDAQGENVEIPPDNNIYNQRKAYGRNGKGRFSAFCFGNSEYLVETRRNDDHKCYKIKQCAGNSPFVCEPVNPPSKSFLINALHGNAIFTEETKHIGISEDRIRSEVGLRFLTDPEFTVYINNQAVIFSDIDSDKISELSFTFKGQPVSIRVIHTNKSDKTTQQHGVAWHVNNRLVGQCSWDGLRNDSILDGRTNVAKRYTFIVKADGIQAHVKSDWSGFNINNDMLEFYDLTKKAILEYITELSKEKRAEITKKLCENNRQKLSIASIIGVSRWNEFIERIQIECPSLTDDELETIADILATLEASTSKYSLMRHLSKCTPENLDDLNNILRDWNIESAKAVLDEIQTCLLIINEIKDKVHKQSTLEVQELQPLFGKGLWIFGPEFESIEYTSNIGMTKVLQNLFRIDTKGSKNRPDFVILQDSSVGLYGCYDYDEHGSEKGIRKVIIVELKRPGISLGSAAKEQCWKYIKELLRKGAILSTAQVDCYLLGESIELSEDGTRTEKDGSVKIIPLVYDTILKRAEKRLLNLHKKIKNAPFLENNKELTEFIAKNTISANEQLAFKDFG